MFFFRMPAAEITAAERKKVEKKYMKRKLLVDGTFA